MTPWFIIEQRAVIIGVKTMRKALSIFAIIAAFGASPAFAAGMSTGMQKQIAGTIQSVHPSAHELMLKNGQRFNVASNFNLGKIKSGEKVTITYTKSGASRRAMKVQTTP